MKRLYGLSSYGTNRIRDTNTHPSTWHNERVNTIRSKTLLDDTKSHDIGNNGIAMEGVVTSVLGNNRGEKGREWSRRNPGSMQKSGAGNESQEELIGKAKGL